MSKSEIVDELEKIYKAFYEIQNIDPNWEIPIVSVDKNRKLYIVEAGSIGIHEGFCDDKGNYWIDIDDGDTTPTRPLLVKERN